MYFNKTINTIYLNMLNDLKSACQVQLTVLFGSVAAINQIFEHL